MPNGLGYLLIGALRIRLEVERQSPALLPFLKSDGNLGWEGRGVIDYLRESLLKSWAVG